MQHDDMIWSSLSETFCSFKAPTRRKETTLCRNKFNLTGLCSRATCPLANSRYATILSHDDTLYLYVKTIERAHMPRAMWEKTKLSRNYAKALEQLDAKMQYWPKMIVHRAKQRLTKMTQVMIRMKRIRLRAKREPTEELVGIKKKAEKRDRNREKKALRAANLENAIEKELLERLHAGAYGEIYNFPSSTFEKVLEREAVQEEEEEEEEDEVEYEEEYEEGEDVDDIEDAGLAQAGFHFDEDIEEEVDPAEALDRLRKRARSKRRPVRIEIEREKEHEDGLRLAAS